MPILLLPQSAAANVIVTPGVATLTLTSFAPTVSAPRLVTVGKATLTLTSFAPTVATPRLVTVGKASLTLTTFVPSVIAPQLITIETLGLSLSSFTPTVTVSQPVAAGGHAGRRYNPISVARPIPTPISAAPRPAHLRLLSSPPSVSVTNELSDNELLLLLEAA